MRERRSLKDFSTAELVIELIARITPRQTIPSPDIVVEDSQKTVMSQRQFCALVGIDRLTCEKLRKLGYIPNQPYQNSGSACPRRIGAVHHRRKCRADRCKRTVQSKSSVE